MNKNHTTDTITYVLNSTNKLSGSTFDCILDMGGYLNPTFTHYHCEVISFFGNSFNTGANFRIINLEAYNFVETGYTTYDISEPKPIISSTSGHRLRQYAITAFKNNFIVKNFNNNRIRFVITNVANKAVIPATFAGTRQWTLILALTPIYKPEYKLYKRISDRIYESFTYSFYGSSEDQYIDLPPILDGNDRYYINVQSCNITTYNISPQTAIAPSHQFSEYYMLYAYNWAENGYYGALNNMNLITLFADQEVTNPNYDPNQGADNPVFIIQNMRSPRRIRFKLFYCDFLPVENTQIQAGFNYLITCCITPID